MKTIELARIFNLDNELARRRELRLLSAAGGTNNKDADESERIALVRKFIKSGKLPKKPSGGLYAEHELLALPLETLKTLFDNTPGNDDAAKSATGKDTPALQDVKNLSVDLASIFNRENACAAN